MQCNRNTYTRSFAAHPHRPRTLQGSQRAAPHLHPRTAGEDMDQRNPNPNRVRPGAHHYRAHILKHALSFSLSHTHTHTHAQAHHSPSVSNSLHHALPLPLSRHRLHRFAPAAHPTTPTEVGPPKRRTCRLETRLLPPRLPCTAQHAPALPQHAHPGRALSASCAGSTASCVLELSAPSEMDRKLLKTHRTTRVYCVRGLEDAAPRSPDSPRKTGLFGSGHGGPHVAAPISERGVTLCDSLRPSSRPSYADARRHGREAGGATSAHPLHESRNNPTPRSPDGAACRRTPAHSPT